MFLTVLAGPLGKWIMGAVGIIFLIGLFFGYVKLKEHDAVAASALAYQNAQLQEVIKENKDHQDKLDKLILSNKELQDKTDALNKELQDNTDTTTAWLNKQIVKTPLDPIFNEMLNKLKNTK